MGEKRNYPFDSRGLSQEARVFLWLVVSIVIAIAVVLVGRWDSPLQAAVKPAADLEQCANLGTVCDSSHAAQWQTGNLGSSNSAYSEGDSVPYRATFSNLTVGQTYKVDLEWDATQSGHHALDYITGFDRTVSAAAPCAGITCGAPTSMLSIPIDTRVTDAGVTPVNSQSFSAYGATFPTGGLSVSNTGDLCGGATCSIDSNPSAYSYVGTYADTSQTRISVFFTANNENVVLAWGGHIASRRDWGSGNSAAAIPGSPYHMRLIDLSCSNVDNCSSGNKDRSLSSAAVTLPSSITVVKQASIEGETEFSFVGSPSPLTSFTLTDDGTTANTRVFSGITSFGTYTVTESVPTKWGLDRVSCSIANQSTGSTSVVRNVATINLGEGEDVLCTFYNSPLPAPALTLTKTADVENFSGAGQLITYTYVIRNSGNVAIGPVQFTVDDDKINGGEPFNCGPAATTLAVDATVTCTAVYTTLTGDIESSITNTAFAAAGEVVSPSKQVTVPYVSTTTTTTTSTTSTTTTLAPTTTTIAPTTTTTVPVELQVVTPDNPTGTEDVLDVLFPEDLPETGIRVGLISIIGGVLLLIGVGTITVSSNRRSRRDVRGGK